ncbi:MAG: hypothetical protein ACUVSH_09220 [Anaerolineae bacterium]
MNGRHIWLGLIIMAALAAAGLIILSGGHPSAPRPAAVRWAGVAAPVPLETGAQRARERAVAWQPDAVLVRVEASFRPGTRYWDALQLPVTWSYTYYSPSARALATVAVNAEKTFWIPPMEAPQPPRPVVPFPPAYAVNRMWMTFRGAGGEEFLRQHPNALVSICLRMGEREPVWEVNAVEGDARLTVRMSAETGVVLP